MKKLLFVFVLLSFISTIQAQKIAYGFKVGLNFSRFSGPSETDEVSGDLESFDFNTGFHVGAAIIYKATDLFGVKAELLFSQKGGKAKYDGEGFQYFPSTNEVLVLGKGNINSFLNISNSYIDIPVIGYGRVLPWLELSAGINLGFLVNSTAAGELIFDGVSNNNLSPISFTSNLEYNYLKDEPLDITTVDENNVTYIPADGQSVVVPKTLGAQYGFATEQEKPFNAIDFGLNAGASFFLNESLYVGLRYNFGISDITKNERDFSRKSTDETGGYITLDQSDKNTSLQVSIGFSF